jgi:hypothetical protein
VLLAINHEVIDSFALLASWTQVNGRCRLSGEPRLRELTFGPTIELTNLTPGRCYELYVAAIDEDFNYAEAISPRIRSSTSRRPGSSARRRSPARPGSGPGRTSGSGSPSPSWSPAAT